MFHPVDSLVSASLIFGARIVDVRKAKDAGGVERQYVTLLASGTKVDSHRERMSLDLLKFMQAWVKAGRPVILQENHHSSLRLGKAVDADLKEVDGKDPELFIKFELDPNSSSAKDLVAQVTDPEDPYKPDCSVGLEKVAAEKVYDDETGTTMEYLYPTAQTQFKHVALTPPEGQAYPDAHLVGITSAGPGGRATQLYVAKSLAAVIDCANMTATQHGAISPETLMRLTDLQKSRVTAARNQIQKNKDADVALEAEITAAKKAMDDAVANKADDATMASCKTKLAELEAQKLAHPPLPVGPPVGGGGPGGIANPPAPAGPSGSAAPTPGHSPGSGLPDDKHKAEIEAARKDVTDMEAAKKEGPELAAAKAKLAELEAAAPGKNPAPPAATPPVPPAPSGTPLRKDVAEMNKDEVTAELEATKQKAKELEARKEAITAEASKAGDDAFMGYGAPDTAAKNVSAMMEAVKAFKDDTTTTPEQWGELAEHLSAELALLQAGLAAMGKQATNANLHKSKAAGTPAAPVAGDISPAALVIIEKLNKDLTALNARVEVIAAAPVQKVPARFNDPANAGGTQEPENFRAELMKTKDPGQRFQDSLTLVGMLRKIGRMREAEIDQEQG